MADFMGSLIEAIISSSLLGVSSTLILAGFNFTVNGVSMAAIGGMVVTILAFAIIYASGIGTGLIRPRV